MSKENFNKLTPPISKKERDRSRGRTPTRKGGGGRERTPSEPKKKKELHGIRYRDMPDGTKAPLCCSSYLRTGVCQWEKDNPGKRCQFDHIDQAAYDKKHKKLNS